MFKSMKVFISHSSTDKKFVRTLKGDLNENNIETWLDEDELRLGDTLIERLDAALEDSSHFLIILSKSSVNSDWVKYELNKALNKNLTLNRRIIAVKYKECQVPKELENLVYEDLTNSVRKIVNQERIEFTTPEYNTFLNRLIKAIKTPEKQLSIQDKTDLKKEITIDPDVYSSSTIHNIVRSSYLIIGYRSTYTRSAYVQSIRRNKPDLNIDEIRPVVLPPLLRNVLPNLNVGDELYFSKNFFGNVLGHFAGFRRDDLAFAIDYEIRKKLVLTKGHRYNMEISRAEKRITIFTR